jgi:hypothetical protein
MNPSDLPYKEEVAGSNPASPTDVCKGRFDVHLLPKGEAFAVNNDAEGIDAQILARFAAAIEPSPSVLPDQEAQALQADPDQETPTDSHAPLRERTACPCLPSPSPGA